MSTIITCDLCGIPCTGRHFTVSLTLKINYVGMPISVRPKGQTPSVDMCPKCIQKANVSVLDTGDGSLSADVVMGDIVKKVCPL